MKPVVRPELRYRRTWMVVGVLMLAVILLFCLMPSGKLPDVNLWDKHKHTLAFLALAFWFGSIVARYDFVWLFLLLVAFGGLIEVLQGSMGLGRSAEWGDLLADTIGVVAGLALALTPLGRVVRWLESRIARARGG